MNDYIKLPRSLLESPIIKNAEALRVSVWLYANADGDGRIQFSSGDAMRLFGTTPRQFRTIVNLLQATSIATIKTTNKTTKITLCDLENCDVKSKSKRQANRRADKPTITTETSRDTSSIGAPTKTTRFTPPTLDEVRNHIIEKGYNVDAEKFIAYYESNGWMVGKNKMRNWKSALVTWNKNQYGTAKPTNTANDYASRAESRRRMSALASEIISADADIILGLYDGQKRQSDNRIDKE